MYTRPHVWFALPQVRAKQFLGDDMERSRILGLLMHGDGSFSGQGIVFETLDLSQLPDYTTGGTIHVVVNNQVWGRRVVGVLMTVVWIGLCAGCVLIDGVYVKNNMYNNVVKQQWSNNQGQAAPPINNSPLNLTHIPTPPPYTPNPLPTHHTSPYTSHPSLHSHSPPYTSHTSGGIHHRPQGEPQQPLLY